MYDFNDVIASTKDEQIRAWSVEQAIEFNRDTPINNVIGFAASIEKFIKEGTA